MKKNERFETSLGSIPEKFAVFVLGISQISGNSLKQETTSISESGDGKILCQDTFETGLDQWHYAEFNLYDMLKSKIKDFLVTEMIMADWDSTGFMKLENGHNPIGVAYYIDNFIIKSEEAKDDEEK